MTVEELPGHLREHWPAIREQLLSGTTNSSLFRSVRTVLLPWPLRLLPLPRLAGSIVPVIARMGGQFRLQGALHDGLLQVRQQSFAAQQVLWLVVAVEQLLEQLIRDLFHRCASSVDPSTYPRTQLFGHSPAGGRTSNVSPRDRENASLVRQQECQRRCWGDLHRRMEGLHHHLGRRHAPRHGEPFRGGVGCPDVHNNDIEGVRLLFKLSIVAVFEQMSKKHLDRYIEEMKRRFNNRNNPHLFRKPSSASSQAIRYSTENWSSTRPPVFSLRQSIQAVRPGLISLGPLEGPRRGLAVCPCPPIAAPCLAARPRSARPAQLPRSGYRSTPRSWPFQP